MKKPYEPIDRPPRKKVGGPQPGSGRPKGSKIPKTKAREAAFHQMLADEQLSAKRVLEELCRLSFVDIRAFFDAAGNVKPMSDWTPEMGACVGSTEIVMKNAAAGDGVIDRVLKFKLWDKAKALESLAKHFGLLVDKQEHSGTLIVRHELAGNDAD